MSKTYIFLIKSPYKFNQTHFPQNNTEIINLKPNAVRTVQSSSLKTHFPLTCAETYTQEVMV